MAKAKKSNANKILNWLKPNSAKEAAFLFLVVFALTGGSYMAYRSFADSATITHPGSQIYSIGNAYQANDCSQSKSCPLTWVVVTGGGVASNFGSINYDGNIACFTAKRVSATEATTARFIINASKLYTQNFNLGTSYTTNCINGVAHGSNIVFELHNINTGNIQVANMSINYGTVPFP